MPSATVVHQRHLWVESQRKRRDMMGLVQRLHNNNNDNSTTQCAVSVLVLVSDTATTVTRQRPLGLCSTGGSLAPQLPVVPLCQAPPLPRSELKLHENWMSAFTSTCTTTGGL